MWNHGIKNRRAQVTFACVATQALIARHKGHTSNTLLTGRQAFKTISSIHPPPALPGIASSGQVGWSGSQEGWKWSPSRAHGSAGSAEPHRRALRAAERLWICRSGAGSGKKSMAASSECCSTTRVHTENVRERQRSFFFLSSGSNWSCPKQWQRPRASGSLLNAAQCWKGCTRTNFQCCI